jgi:hypothetical protein
LAKRNFLPRESEKKKLFAEIWTVGEALVSGSDSTCRSIRRSLLALTLRYSTLQQARLHELRGMAAAVLHWLTHVDSSGNNRLVASYTGPGLLMSLTASSGHPPATGSLSLIIHRRDTSSRRNSICNSRDRKGPAGRTRFALHVTDCDC